MCFELLMLKFKISEKKFQNKTKLDFLNHFSLHNQLNQATFINQASNNIHQVFVL